MEGEELKDKIREKAFDLGINLVRFCSVTKWEEIPIQEPEFWPLELYQQIRYVYDYDDEISNNLMEWFNQNREVSYEISPVTTLELSPATEQLFGVTDYPERFRKWLEDFIWFVSDFTAEENTDNASAPVPISVPYGDFTLIGNNTNTQLQTA